MWKHRNFTDQFKTKVDLEGLRGDETVQAIAAKYQLRLLSVGVCLQTPIDYAGLHLEAAGQ